LDIKKLEDHGIKVSWMDYSNYKEYDQLYGDFNHQVSIIDLIFNMGPQAADYLFHSQKEVNLIG